MPSTSTSAHSNQMNERLNLVIFALYAKFRGTSLAIGDVVALKFLGFFATKLQKPSAKTSFQMSQID